MEMNSIKSIMLKEACKKENLNKIELVTIEVFLTMTPQLIMRLFDAGILRSCCDMIAEKILKPKKDHIRPVRCDPFEEIDTSIVWTVRFNKEKDVSIPGRDTRFGSNEIISVQLDGKIYN